MLPDDAPGRKDEVRHPTLQLGRTAAVNEDIGATHYLYLEILQILEILLEIFYISTFLLQCEWKRKNKHDIDLNTFMWVLFYRGLYPFIFTSQNIFMDSQI